MFFSLKIFFCLALWKIWKGFGILQNIYNFACAFSLSMLDKHHSPTDGGESRQRQALWEDHWWPLTLEPGNQRAKRGVPPGWSRPTHHAMGRFKFANCRARKAGRGQKEKSRGIILPGFYFTFTFMHLADAFIQSDLHCIQVTVFSFYQLLLSLGIEPMILVLLAPCSTIWATGKLYILYIFIFIKILLKTSLCFRV